VRGDHDGTHMRSQEMKAGGEAMSDDPIKRIVMDKIIGQHVVADGYPLYDAPDSIMLARYIEHQLRRSEESGRTSFWASQVAVPCLNSAAVKIRELQKQIDELKSRS